MSTSLNTNQSLNSILDEVIAWSTPPSLEENEFTVDDYIARLESTKGITATEGAARARLNREVKAGRLTKRPVVLGGTRRNAYKVVPPSKEVDITSPS